MHHTSNDSGGSVFTLHDDEVFKKHLLELMDPKLPDSPRLTDAELNRMALATLRMLEGIDQEGKTQTTITSHIHPEKYLQIDVHLLLTTMLTYSKICGSQRYVASAIISAERSYRDSKPGHKAEAVITELKRLAEDWLYLLLWPSEFLSLFCLHSP